MPEPKLVIFDFCGTLISFQTADRYVDFCVRHLTESKQVRLRHRIICILEKLKCFKIYNIVRQHNNWHKRMILWQLKGIPFSRCDDLAHLYFEQELLPNIVQPLLKIMQQHINNNDRVCILSGGYDIYIRLFAQHFGVKEFISSIIDFRNGYCTGKMQGDDCMGRNKITCYQQLKKEASYTVFYSDSPSDLPLLELVDEPVVVSKDYAREWAAARNFKQIIWT